MTKEEFNRIIEFISNKLSSANGLRNLVLILLLGLLGLRTATIIALDVEHIDTENGLAWITEKGQNNDNWFSRKYSIIFLKSILLSTTQGEALFLSVRKKRLSPRILQDIFRTVVDELGINKRLHAHLSTESPYSRLPVIQLLPISTKLPGQLSLRPFLVMSGDTIH